MDFFPKEHCSACQGEVGFRRHKIRNGLLCPSCFKIFKPGYGVLGPWRTLEEIKAKCPAPVAGKATGQLTPDNEAMALAEPQPLNTLTKLQFRKYVSEQSGMTLLEADTYLDGLQNSEREDLVRAFQSQQPSRSPEPTSLSAPSPVVPSPPATTQPQCPKCKSFQTTYTKQGFGVGKAAVGAILTGGIGLLAGGIGKNNIVITCLKCGHQWKVR